MVDFRLRFGDASEMGFPYYCRSTPSHYYYWLGMGIKATVVNKLVALGLRFVLVDY